MLEFQSFLLTEIMGICQPLHGLLKKYVIKKYPINSFGYLGKATSNLRKPFPTRKFNINLILKSYLLWALNKSPFM